MHFYGYSEEDINLLWDNIQDTVIKTFLTAYHELKAEYWSTIKPSTVVYNSYKLLGLDILVDECFNAHVIEVNARPALLDDPVDKAVNRPMV